MFGRFRVLRALQRTPRFAAPDTAFRPKSDHTTLAHWQRVRVRSTGVFDSSSVRISCGLILYSKGIKMMMLSRPRRAPDDNYRGHTGRRPGASDATMTRAGGEGRAATRPRLSDTTAATPRGCSGERRPCRALHPARVPRFWAGSRFFYPATVMSPARITTKNT